MSLDITIYIIAFICLLAHVCAHAMGCLKRSEGNWVSQFSPFTLWVLRVSQPGLAISIFSY